MSERDDDHTALYDLWYHHSYDEPTSEDGHELVDAILDSDWFAAKTKRLEFDLAAALRELVEAKLQIAELAKASYGGISEHVHGWQKGAPGSKVLWCACGQSRWDVLA